MSRPQAPSKSKLFRKLRRWIPLLSFLLSIAFYVVPLWVGTDSKLAHLDYWSEILRNAWPIALAPTIVIAIVAAVLWRLRIYRWQLFLLVGFPLIGICVAAAVLIANYHLLSIHQEMEQLVLNHYYVAYEPTEYDPLKGKMPTEDEVREELSLLHSSRDGGNFDGLITFHSEGTLAEIPRIAKEVGFRAVIMGISIDEDESVRARKLNEQLLVAEVKKGHVDAYCLGHNTIQKVPLAQLKEWMAELRKRTKKPVTTTAPLNYYLGTHGREFRSIGDFHFPDVAPAWLGDGPRKALESVERAIEKMTELPDDKPILLKMLSFPTKGSALATPEGQNEFFTGLMRDIDFLPKMNPSIFSGFDLKWKYPPHFHETEQYVGLIKKEKTPPGQPHVFTGKPALAILRNGPQRKP